MTNTFNSNQNNSNMANLLFTPAIANPVNLNAHPILIEMGYGRTADVYFIETMKYFNHYDKPVVDLDDNVITHWSEVQAAVANGIAQLEVYSVDMTVIQLRRFIALKHKYHRKDLIASFNTVKYFEQYLSEDAEGIRLAETMEGTLREKIAKLMQTSDSTVKRLKEVGLNAFDKLGLIEQGFTSFKQVTDQIKADRLAAKTAERKAATATHVEPTPEGDDYIEPITNPEDKVILDVPGKYYVPNPTENDNIGDKANNGNEPYYSGDVEGNDNGNQMPAKPLFQDFNCMFSSEGVGLFEISVTDNIPTVTINGREIENMSYEPIVDSGNANGTTHSFVLSQPGKNALCIQLTVENLSKAA
jgi:predicted nucleotidyltransferase